VQEFAHAVAVTLTALHGIVVLGMVTALSIVIVVLLLRRGQHLEVAMVASLTGASSSELRRVVRLLLATATESFEKRGTTQPFPPKAELSGRF
jgi:hypothetical protein